MRDNADDFEELRLWKRISLASAVVTSWVCLCC